MNFKKIKWCLSPSDAVPLSTMTTKANKNSPLTQALLETANDMHGIGLLENDAYEKITMRHLGIKKPEIEPLSAEEITESKAGGIIRFIGTDRTDSP